MLELKNIVKIYPSGGENIRALKGIDLKFRNNEFVSILGPSGCGKTTMLNIIGGLDHYTEGDLIINGRSTKEYRARDWDTYRNHSIGFVFQSYNLIPHQTVLSNVELALTLSGVGKRERRERAKKALEAVGLGNQLKKRPAQMSGGQMQRVAIARAIVNDPDIILADEPTGALDSETSVQVMNILKEIAQDRLVVMVTHNPDLAEQYSTRLIRMLDGTVLSDSRPIAEEELAALQQEDLLAEAAGSRKAAAAMAAGGAAGAALSPAGVSPSNGKRKKKKKASMSFATAFGLSLNNLFTKKGRTLLTSFAGSIGIIGIALIFAVSQGTSDYIDTVQEDTLSSYPLTITSEAADFGAIISGFVSSTKAAEESRQENSVIEQPVIGSMFGGIGTNDLRSLKAHLEANTETLSKDVNAIVYSYGITPQIFTIDVNGDLLQANPGKLTSYMSASGGYASYGMSGMSLFSEMVDCSDFVKEQYDLLAGEWPENYDEMVLVLSSPGKITDMLTYTIGLHDPNELADMITAVMSGEIPEPKEQEMKSWTYDELLNLDFRLISATDWYRRDHAHNVWEDMSTDKATMKRLFRDGTKLKVCGVVCAKAGSNAATLSVGFDYLPGLTRRVMENAAGTDIVKAQLKNEEINVFSGKPFGEESEENGLDFSEMISVDEEAIAGAFDMSFDTSVIPTLLKGYLNQLVNSLSADTTTAAKNFSDGFTSLATGMLDDYINENGEGGSAELVLGEAESVADGYLASEAAQEELQKLAKKYGVEESMLTTVYKPLLTAMIARYVAENTEDFTPGSEEDTPSEEPAPPAEEAPPEENAEENPPDSGEETEEENPGEAEQTPPEQPENPGEAQEEQGNGEVQESEEKPEEPRPDNPELPAVDIDSLAEELMNAGATISAGEVSGVVADYASNALTSSVSSAMGIRLIAPTLRSKLESSISAYAQQLIFSLAGGMSVDEEAIANAFNFDMSEADMTRLITALAGGSSAANASDNLRKLGYMDPEEPDSISFYLKDFEGKERVVAFLDDYNTAMEESGEEDKVIQYTDITGVLMSSVTTIIDAVTYVLIAFVAISLVVSSIMIGVITLISVQERTKEIGILRAIGASKRNVSSMFNAETVIIGFSSGLIGVLVTYALCIPINMILHKLTGISYLSAKLPVEVAVVLVLISMGLTLIAGIIPSRSAAKKDPVVALRTE